MSVRPHHHDSPSGPDSPSAAPAASAATVTAPVAPAVPASPTATADSAGDVVRWAAFSCLLVPVVLVVFGTSVGGAAVPALRPGSAYGG
ncbi:hypothetical protein SSPS47_10955 [Streptomyces sp. S4.7]|uniref:hypothetical protein n=1 Tax=Streptomyces sp. S4.7 TaxID=2705439 RepID=UPI001397184F|nr:hypothetical protein [Streptomyces sp. S4.7]QHY95638.1 hypothetical protein SSPS47_10955 [Streptomyces sp. S4.7]